MVKVYYKPISSYSQTELISKSAKELLRTVIEREKLTLEPEVPVKVHFGEKGNKTFIEPKNFEGIISYLKENDINSSFIETNALYRGSRTEKKNHVLLAKEHGFTHLPIIIADGEIGGEFKEIKIRMKHFEKFKIAKKIADLKQLIVLSHLKGHYLAGFGGAVKQLAMGCSASGGKLDMHANSYPLLNPFECRKCKTCLKHCPVNALKIGTISRIDKKKCIGCAACIAVCPHGAIKINWLSNLPKTFYEKLAEYAYAANKDKKNIFINFALNITRGCDCIGHEMKPIAHDTGIFASTDPVAIDKACLDMLEKKEGKKFRGMHTLDYAEEIGLGKKDYELISVD